MPWIFLSFLPVHPFPWNFCKSWQALNAIKKLLLPAFFTLCIDILFTRKPPLLVLKKTSLILCVSYISNFFLRKFNEIIFQISLKNFLGLILFLLSSFYYFLLPYEITQRKRMLRYLQKTTFFSKTTNYFLIFFLLNFKFLSLFTWMGLSLFT